MSGKNNPLDNARYDRMIARKTDVEEENFCADEDSQDESIFKNSSPSESTRDLTDRDMAHVAGIYIYG